MQNQQLGFVLINTIDELARIVKIYSKSGSPIAVDVESTGTNPYHDKLIMIQMARQGKKPVIFDARDKNPFTVGVAMLDLLNNSGLTIIGQGIKFDMSFMVAYLGVNVAGVNLVDTMLNEQVIEGVGITTARSQGVGLRLDDIAARYGLEVSKAERSWFIDLDQRKEEWSAAFPQEQLDYAAKDVSVLFPIYEKQLEKIAKYKLENAVELESASILPVVALETNGVRINRDGWMGAIAHVVEQSSVIESELHAIIDPYILACRDKKYVELFTPWTAWDTERKAFESNLRAYYDALVDPSEKWGEWKRRMIREWKEANVEPKRPKADTTSPNLGSSVQLKEALNMMGIDVSNTGKQEFEELADGNPTIAKLLDYKAAAKLENAFGQKLIDKVDQDRDRLYPRYQQIGADTGRMSSFSPNLQQIPSKGVGAILRHHVIPAEGNVFVIADFSNIELRILANYSRDEKMLAAFNAGRDLHSQTAVMMFNLEHDDDNYDAIARQEAIMNGRALGTTWRNIAKTINFGLIYGMGPTKLGKTLKISSNDAKAIMTKYFELYAGVKSWMDQQKKRVDKAMEAKAKRMYSLTVSGRKRWYTFPNHPSLPMRATREQAKAYEEALEEYRGAVASIKRQCGNSPIQGSSADITKLALVKVQDRLGFNGIGKLCFVVHDEIGLECRAEDAEQVSSILAVSMQQAAEHYLKSVKLPPVEPLIVDHWMH